ncbi:MAG TPA: hypothetical protein VGK26_03630 [Thermoanaerobaculia bacterium]|jgi:hypothetical protein
MLIAALLLSALLASTATPVEVARAEAEENVKSPAGLRYEGVVIGRVDEWLRPALRRCLKDLPKEELVSFDGLVRVGAEGKPAEVVFGPETALARCVAPDFRDADYPRPPKPDWWIKIEVRPK